MQPASPEVRDFLHARLDALLDECNLVTANADYGQTLDDLEEFFFTKGRKFLHDTYGTMRDGCIMQSDWRVVVRLAVD